MVIIHKSEKLGQVLKRARKACGLSQSEVASELGYASGQFISNWERGLAAPPANVMYDLVKLYGMDEKQILDILINEFKTGWKKLNKKSKSKKTKAN